MAATYTAVNYESSNLTLHEETIATSVVRTLTADETKSFNIFYDFDFPFDIYKITLTASASVTLKLTDKDDNIVTFALNSSNQVLNDITIFAYDLKTIEATHTESTDTTITYTCERSFITPAINE